MAIASLNHTSLGKQTQSRPYTAAAHVRYISRSSECTVVAANHIPICIKGEGVTSAKNAQRWLREEEDSDRKNARMIEKIRIALPRELDQYQLVKLVTEYIKELTRGRVPWYVAFHLELDRIEEPDYNPHCHIVIRDRDIETGKRVINFSAGRSEKQKAVKQNIEFEYMSTERVRQIWQGFCNRALDDAGREERINMLSYKRQGQEVAPTIHEGVTARILDDKGIEPVSKARTVRKSFIARDAVVGADVFRVVDYPAIDKGSRMTHNKAIMALRDNVANQNIPAEEFKQVANSSAVTYSQGRNPIKPPPRKGKKMAYSSGLKIKKFNVNIKTGKSHYLGLYKEKDEVQTYNIEYSFDAGDSRPLYDSDLVKAAAKRMTYAEKRLIGKHSNMHELFGQYTKEQLIDKYIQQIGQEATAAMSASPEGSTPAMEPEDDPPSASAGAAAGMGGGSPFSGGEPKANSARQNNALQESLLTDIKEIDQHADVVAAREAFAFLSSDRARIELHEQRDASGFYQAKGGTVEFNGQPFSEGQEAIRAKAYRDAEKQLKAAHKKAKNDYLALDPDLQRHANEAAEARAAEKEQALAMLDADRREEFEALNDLEDKIINELHRRETGSDDDYLDGYVEDRKARETERLKVAEQNLLDTLPALHAELSGDNVIDIDNSIDPDAHNPAIEIARPGELETSEDIAIAKGKLKAIDGALKLVENALKADRQPEPEKAPDLQTEPSQDIIGNNPDNVVNLSDIKNSQSKEDDAVRAADKENEVPLAELQARLSDPAQELKLTPKQLGEKLKAATARDSKEMKNTSTKDFKREDENNRGR